VILPAGRWRIGRVANEARKGLESPELHLQKRVIIRLEALQSDPLAGDVKKIKGKKDIFRLRPETVRVYVRLDAGSRLIDILLIDRRGQIKDKTIERL
jgi:mRNA-degrading endonuclease RelE of RelBE toxin-antitoxin system